MILAVCSKNEEETAKRPFVKREDFPLKLADFGSFIANWGPKDISLRTVANDLNIGLDSIVFVDDNPAERALVRRTLPQVSVLELPDDPAEYNVALNEQNYFDVPSITDEDLDRTRQYQAQLAQELTKSGKI